ncbi:MAG: alpha/beta fold hydrolase [Cyanothece sp. SIO1E1]|nr:alpha/beta fold hydrolase [Cyanothece sp. SIO1E1]
MSQADDQAGLGIGAQRDWIWRGWRVRYTYIRTANHNQPALPILLLHGFGASIGQWRYNLQPLSQQHSVYALDMLCFGASHKAAAAYNVELWVAQVYDFWRTWIGCPIILLGHSLGALVALSATIAHPEMVQGLIMLTLPGTRQESLPDRVQPIVSAVEGLFAGPWLLRPLFQWVRQPQFLRAALKRVYIKPDLVTDELVSIFATPTQDQGVVRAFCYLCKSATQPDYGPNVQRLLLKLNVPSLLLWGQQDWVVPLSRGHTLAANHPHLQLVEFPEVGHCFYDEDPAAVNQSILDWIASQGVG